MQSCRCPHSGMSRRVTNQLDTAPRQHTGIQQRLSQYACRANTMPSNVVSHLIRHDRPRRHALHERHVLLVGVFASVGLAIAAEGAGQIDCREASAGLGTLQGAGTRRCRPCTRCHGKCASVHMQQLQRCLQVACMAFVSFQLLEHDHAACSGCQGVVHDQAQTAQLKCFGMDSVAIEVGAAPAVASSAAWDGGMSPASCRKRRMRHAITTPVVVRPPPSCGGSHPSGWWLLAPSAFVINWGP